MLLGSGDWDQKFPDWNADDAAAGWHHIYPNLSCLGAFAGSSQVKDLKQASQKLLAPLYRAVDAISAGQLRDLPTIDTFNLFF